MGYTVKNLFKKNDIIDLKIDDVTIEGVGVGRYMGIAVFVPHTAVGDFIEARIIKVKSSYLVGKIENILAPSEDRVEPDCKISDKCGGCVFRHISYSAELKIKQKQVYDALTRIGGFKDICIDNIIGSEKILNYRNKVQVPVGYDSAGNLISGFYGNHSHRIVSCDECFLHPKIFDEIITYIKKWMNQNNVSAYDEKTGQGLVRHIYLRCAENGQEVMLCMVINGRKLPMSDSFVDSITSKFECVKSIMINVNAKATNVILGEGFVTLFGKDYILDSLCGMKFKISPDSFYQVNHDQAQVLYNIGAEVLSPTEDDSLVDLYCGTGTIGLSMAKKVKNLLGVEIVPSAVKNAIENAKINLVDNAEFICGDSGSVFGKNIKNMDRSGIVIVDPPRKGCSDELIEDLIKILPSKILYISCNPATLAKDLKKLCDSGEYKIDRVVPVDMFPRTAHVETVVLLSRS